MFAKRAKPTAKYDGSDRDKYTVPAIQNNSTGEVISDSQAIVAYLDEEYPDTPKLIPDGCSTAISLLLQTFGEVFAAIRNVSIPATMGILNEGSVDFFRQTREESFGKKFEDIAPVGEKYNEAWEAMRQGLAKLAALYDRNAPGSLLYFGETFTFADACVISVLVYLRIVIGAETSEWKSVEECCEGRWKKLLDEYEHLYTVHDEPASPYEEEI